MLVAKGFVKLGEQPQSLSDPQGREQAQFNLNGVITTHFMRTNRVITIKTTISFNKIEKKVFFRYQH